MKKELDWFNPLRLILSPILVGFMIAATCKGYHPMKGAKIIMLKLTKSTLNE
jgi:hypothetical protein